MFDLKLARRQHHAGNTGRQAGRQAGSTAYLSKNPWLQGRQAGSTTKNFRIIQSSRLPMPACKSLATKQEGRQHNIKSLAPRPADSTDTFRIISNSGSTTQFSNYFKFQASRSASWQAHDFFLRQTGSPQRR